MNRPDRPMRPKSLYVLALTLFACVGGDSNVYRPLAIGDVAPDYGAPTLGGDTIRLESLRGSPVLLNVWATWCPPCREEMPALQELHERYADRGLRVVGVSVDSRGAEAAIRQFLDEGGLTFT